MYYILAEVAAALTEQVCAQGMYIYLYNISKMFNIYSILYMDYIYIHIYIYIYTHTHIMSYVSYDVTCIYTYIHTYI